LGREPTPLDLEHLVPTAGLVEPERGTGRRGSEGILELVPVEELGLGRHDRLERRLADPADPPQRVADLLLLRLDLPVVREILEAAAAAGRVVRAGGVDASRARPPDLERARPGVAPLHLPH